MKLDSKLAADLEAISKEVESWPAWKRSIDLRNLNKENNAHERTEKQAHD